MHEDLINLVTRITDEPWPTTDDEHRQWASRLDLPTDGTPIPTPEEEPPGARNLHAESDGRHVFWAFSGGQFAYLGLIIPTLQEAEFDGLMHI